MKRVRLITTDDHNGKEAISRTPLRNKYFFEGAWHEVNVTVKPEILRDAQIIEVTEAVFAELGDTFDIRVLTRRVESEMFDSGKQPREATIDRQLRQLRKYNKLNYEVVDEQAGTYRKLPVNSKPEQLEANFKPDWKKRFIEFLKEEGAYEKFEENIKNPYLQPLKLALAWKNIFSQPESKYLERAFMWIASRPGYNFWSELNMKWRGICDGKN